MSLSTSTAERPAVTGSPVPFFRLLDFDCGQAGDHSECIGQIRAGQLTGIAVRSVYEAEVMADIVERLERHDPPFLKTSFPEKFRSWFYGRNLNLMSTDPATYFAQAREFHRQMRELFSEDLDINERLMGVLSCLDEGRPYRSAPGPEPEQAYMLTTFRGHAEGGYIPAHCDNEQSVRPAYEHLRTLVSDHMYSMVLMIGASDDGGVLEVFNHCVEPSSIDTSRGDNVGPRAGKIDLTTLSSAQIRLQPGDMAIVDSGRYLHRVTPVQGSKTRWVACSFMAHALDRRAVYCWG